MRTLALLALLPTIALAAPRVTLPSSAGGVAIKDEGAARGTATTIDCTGAGVTCSVAAGTATFNVTAGGGVNVVEVEVDFGATESDDVASTVVTGQAWVSAGSKIVCAPTMLATSSRDEGAEDAVVEGLVVAVHSRVAGTGFTVTAAATHGTTGIYKIHCTGG